MRAKLPYMTQLHAWAEVAKLILVSSQVVDGIQVPDEKLRLIAVLEIPVDVSFDDLGLVGTWLVAFGADVGHDTITMLRHSGQE